ncbi:hypothetical protein FW755_12620 [Lonepinella koalarum]|uniref:antA/AntB antirepressor family protein n=1 Tax=Lonepinella koalarum TaxID=53417 RepID=UPI0011E3FF01|nr:antA/AntB antirepressor family protein [Lonepinella koalarum]TYG33280.1 hypothetical protein FW755_12620 [Lonepinella koalarum]
MTNTNLIPVFNGQIENQPVQLCNARELHTFLESNRQYANWISERITEYGFIENEDYIITTERTNGRPRKEYHITLEMGKELGMVERNAKGRQIRQYFIACEKQAKGEQTAVKIAPLSKQHQQNIKELVLGRAKSLPKDQQARATITQWAALKTHFGKSYKDINDDQYLEAISLLARLPLDGELLLDPPQAPQTGIVLTPDELALLLRLWSSSTNLHESGHHLLRRLNGLLVGREVDSLQFNVRLHTELLKAIHPLIERLMPQVQQPPKTLLLGHAKH